MAEAALEEALCDMSERLPYEINLKPQQRESIVNLLHGRDVLAVLPTGFKSLIFQMFMQSQHVSRTTREVKATGGKRYVALSEPFLQQESSSLSIVRGISVAGKPVVLPQDNLGSVALVLLWTREHGQKTCDIYREAFTKEFENSKNTECYEVNIIDSWLFRLMKTIISKNLRGQVPLHRQENFLCCYENTSNLIEATFENTLVGHAVLVDRAGFIRWKAHGTPTDEELTHLINCTSELQNEIALGVK